MATAHFVVLGLPTGLLSPSAPRLLIVPTTKARAKSTLRSTPSELVRAVSHSPPRLQVGQQLVFKAARSFQLSPRGRLRPRCPPSSSKAQASCRLHSTQSPSKTLSDLMPPSSSF